MNWACSVLFGLLCLGEQQTGGELDFVYGTSSIGSVMWAKTTDSDLLTDKWDWHRPAGELANTRSAAKFADRLLRGDGVSNCTDFAEGKCSLAANLSAPGWGYDACCWVANQQESDPQTLHNWLEENIANWGDLFNPNCMDLLNPAYIQSVPYYFVHSVFAAFADALPTDTSCEGSHAGMHV